MIVAKPGALASALCVSLLLARTALAVCTTTGCPDANAVNDVRSLVAAACDCSGTTSHKHYVRCAKTVIKAAIRDHHLAPQCKQTVRRCEARSTCGLKGAMVCCVPKGAGQIKALVMKKEHKCHGTACTGPLSVVDACTADGKCAKVRRGLKAFRALGSCHSVIAHKGNLVLDSEDVSYANLLNRPAALADAHGMLRVKPGDPDNSFLIRKLRGLGPGYGMPQAAGELPEPVINMIEQWIARGAQTTAAECASRPGQEDLCDSGTDTGGTFVWHPEPPLDPPAPNEGIQFYTPPRDVPSGTEWEMCYAFRPDVQGIATLLGLPAGQLPTIKEQVYRMHKGSHHLLLYMYFGQHPDGFAQGYFPCNAANCINPSDCPPDEGDFLLPVGGTQVAGTRYEVTYPKGVGIPMLSPTPVLIADIHYTNPFQPPQPIYGEAWLNLYFHAPGEFKALLDGIFAINYRDLIVEPYQSRTISSIWQPRNILTHVPEDAAVFQLFGHMHKRGTLFQIDYVKGGACSVSNALCGRDDDCQCKPWQHTCQPGQTCVRAPDAEDTTVYYTTQWDAAPVVNYPPPYFFVNKDQGLRWTCTHTNGAQGDPNHPAKKCQEGCAACGWDDASRTCIFTRGVDLGVDQSPRTYNEGDDMPLVFGLLADDDMCNMFGYFINQAVIPTLPQ
jgi:hypothetical protein